MRGLGLGFINPGGTGGKWDVCVFWLRRCGWCWGGAGGAVWSGSGRVWWCGVKSVFVVSLDYLC